MEGSVDRISELPEGILHHVLSFLLTEDAIRAAATCKRLNQVWLTLPYLRLGEIPGLPAGSNTVSSKETILEEEETILEEETNIGEDEGVDVDVEDVEEVVEENEEAADDEEFLSDSSSESDVEEEQDCEDNVRKREKLITFVEQTLARRRAQDLTLHKFQLGMTKPDVEMCQYLDRWIDYLLHCNIKEVSLHVAKGEDKDGWYSLPTMLLTATSLHALSLKRCRVPCGSIINLPSLRKLHLQLVYLDELMFKEMINTCGNLEYLHISLCPGLRKIEVSGLPHLRVVVFMPHYAVADEVLVEAQHLEKLTYCGGSLPIRINIITNFEGCLKSLSLYGAHITNVWFLELISRLAILEELILSQLNLKSIEITSSSLKRLVLSRVFRTYRDDGIGEIRVHAPKLLYLKYVGCLTYRFLCSLAVKEVVLVIEDVTSKHPDKELCSKLMQFLPVFDYSEVVKMECAYFEPLIFSVEKRLNLLAPLAHIKHLILQGRFQNDPLCSLEKLLESVLWISPNMVNLSLKDRPLSPPKGYPIDVLMKIPAGQCDYSTVSGRCLIGCRLHGKIEFEGASAQFCSFLSGFYSS